MTNNPATFAASVLGLVVLSALPIGAQASTGRSDFQILMNGRPVGHHVVTVTEADGITTARIAIDMAGRVGPIGFSYTHRCEERWRGNQLLRLDCTDRENRSSKSVSGSLVGGKFVVQGTGFKGAVPAEIVPTSWWRSATVRQSRILNSRDGKLTSIQAKSLGETTVNIGGVAVPATHYRIRGPANTDVYYDKLGRWVGTAFRLAGQSFVYQKLTPLSSAPRD